MVSKRKYYELKESGKCVKCGKVRESSPSSVRCKPCHDKFKSKKRSNPQTQRILEEVTPSETCKVCKTKIEDYDIVCRGCLTRTEFSLSDALKKLGPECRECDDSDLNRLCIVSDDISKPRSLSGPDSYKAICQSKRLPGYTVLCNVCYWELNALHIKRMYEIFDSAGQELLEDEEDDILEAEYEVND